MQVDKIATEKLLPMGFDSKWVDLCSDAEDQGNGSDHDEAQQRWAYVSLDEDLHSVEENAEN